MLEPVFLDTGYFVALLNPRDSLHLRARELAEEWGRTDRPAVTTDAVLMELGNFFARSPLRIKAIAAVRRMRTAAVIELVHVTPALFERGITRYTAHPDKSWSLTDCVSMEVMVDKECREAGTPDHHFEQAGFVALMRP